MVAGLASAGVDVLRLGVLPTPGVAYLTGSLDADLGVMLSASHNPMPDNGIKFLARGGVKLDDAIETPSSSGCASRGSGRPAPRSAGSRRTTTAVADYADAPRRRPSADLSTGSGSCSTAPTARPPRPARRRCARPGAEVVAICAEPDGLNINDGCGSTHLEVAAARRSSSTAPTSGSPSTATPTAAWPSTASGEVVDGDQILAVLALAMRDAGHARRRHRRRHRDEQPRLRPGDAPRAASGSAQTKVGDRYVLEAMKAGGYTLGGEQSGHVIMSDHATTGDGILTALHVLRRMAATGAVAGRAGGGDDPAAAGAGQRPGRRQGRAPTSDAVLAGGGRRGARPSWATPAGCCCGRRAPSRWCG